MKESALEGLLFTGVRARGGIAIKLTPTVAGIPDRCVFLPNGRTILVELKADDGSVAKVQELWHQRLAAIGHPVRVVRGRAGLDAFLEELA